MSEKRGPNANELFPMTGIERIAKERKRQTDKLGWSPEHDDAHDGGELAMAAACYASPERLYVQRKFAAGVSFVDPFPSHWPDVEDAVLGAIAALLAPGVATKENGDG